MPYQPDAERRRQGKRTIVVEATRPGGRTVRGEVEGTDSYGKTAIIAVEAVRRLAADGAKAGAAVPGRSAASRVRVSCRCR